MSVDRLSRSRDRVAIAAAWGVAVAATVGSLYYGRVAGLVPCRLCWYERALMYPLVVVLGVALLRELPVGPFALPLSVSGAGVAAYHSWLQMSAGAQCSVGGCGAVQHRLLGLTIPNQALLAFAFVSLAVCYAARSRDALGWPFERTESGRSVGRN